MILVYSLPLKTSSVLLDYIDVLKLLLERVCYAHQLVLVPQLVHNQTVIPFYLIILGKFHFEDRMDVSLNL